MEQEWTSALRRARYLFLLAFLFRLQMWAFSLGQSPWTDLLKVDVLNCMGTHFAPADAAGLRHPKAARNVERGYCDWNRGDLTRHFNAELGLAAPAVSDYFVPNLNHFAIFPWASFIAFGVSAGCLLRMAKAEDMNRSMQWSALLGFGLLLSSQYFSNLPYSIYTSTDFWLNSPGLGFS